MIHLDAVIRHFGAEAVQLQLDEAKGWDDRALTSIRNKGASDRIEFLVSWLNYYRVFQGFPAQNRLSVASVVLQWADARDLGISLGATEALIQAHSELNAACSKADGRNRDFTSLASKALWLCYPHDTPMFDSFVQRALWIIAKTENGGITGPPSQSKFERFVYLWKILYGRYSAALNEIDICRYPYRVRIFDKILWIIGYPDYEYRKS